MISNKQLQANQKNARLGGIKTEAGKEISKFNALDHGLLRQTLTEYEKDFYLGIYADFVEQYQPVTLFEKILVERATIYYLKLFRVQKAEQEYMKATMNPRIVESNNGLPNLTELLGVKENVVNEGYIQKLTEENVQKLADIYTRYEVTIENRFFKVIHELEKAIAIRKGQSIPPSTLNIIQMGSFRRNT